MKMEGQQFLLKVPYYSQRLDVRRAFWRPRACGMVALKMAMDYLGTGSARHKKSSVDQLIDLGMAIHAHDPENGWIHNGLVAIAKLGGFKKSYRQEWATKDRIDGVEIIVELLSDKTPVLASMMSRTGGHLVTLVGLMTDAEGACVGFFYHDPNAADRKKGKNKKITLNTFMKDWKGRIVVVKR